MLYEGLLAFGLVFVVGLIFGLITQTRNAMDNRFGLQTVVFAALAMYFTWFWSKGQTLAMKTWHMRLAMPDGSRVPRQRAFLRYIFSWGSVLPPVAVTYFMQTSTPTLVASTLCWLLIWTGFAQFRKDRQLPQDIFAGTLLVHDQAVVTPSHQQPAN